MACAVCNRSDAPEVDRRLASGEDPESVAIALGIAPSRVRRHVAHGARPQVAKFAPAVPVPPESTKQVSQSSLETAQTNLDRANDVWDSVCADRMSDVRDKALALRTLNEATQTLAKLRGDVAPPEVVIARSPQWKRGRIKMIEFFRSRLGMPITTELLGDLAALLGDIAGEVAA